MRLKLLMLTITMIKMYKKILLALLVGLFLSSPFLALAEFKAQQSYPNIGGNELVSNTASESIPKLVMYIFNLIVWLCILAAILVLILGGIQYVSSSGDVSKMSSAKTRIYSSLLGLLILIGTWFVLHTINPTIVIPKITYIPLKQGIVFFTKEGYEKFRKATDPAIINDLVQNNQAKLISHSSPDLTAEFGPLVFSKCDDEDEDHLITIAKEEKKKFPTVIVPEEINAELNFADFRPYALAFWGEKAQGARVIFYSQTNFQQPEDKPMPYDYRGLLDGDDNKVAQNNSGNINCIVSHSAIKDVIIISPNCLGMAYDNFQSFEYHFFSLAPTKYLKAANYFTADKDVNKLEDKKTATVSGCIDTGSNYFNLVDNQDFRLKDENQGATKTGTNIKHPPLSVKIVWSTPGVYLYSQNSDNRYFDVSAKDFRSSSVNFDQKASEIKIINDVTRVFIDEDGKENTKKEEHDFLAILHENDNFSGNLKVFFEQRMYGEEGDVMSQKTKTILPAYSVCGTPINETLFNKGSAKNASLLTLDESIADTAKQLSTLLFQNTDNKLYYWIKYNFGHLPMIKFEDNGEIFIENGIQKTANRKSIWASNNALYNVSEGGRYGFIDKKVASIQVFELSNKLEDCQEVSICTEKLGRGYCLSYTGDTSKKNETNIVYYPMPWYLPVPLPFNFDDFSFGKTHCKDSVLPEFTTSDGKKILISFANNIKSITIKGKCAVVLMGELKDAVWWEALRFNTKAASRNEVFTSSENNLEDNEIGQCGSKMGFGRWFIKSCAAAIAVYPIK